MSLQQIDAARPRCPQAVSSGPYFSALRYRPLSSGGSGHWHNLRKFIRKFLNLGFSKKFHTSYAAPPTRSYSIVSSRRAGVKKLGNGNDKLRWRERLRQHDTVRDALGRPIVSVFAAHVNDGEVSVDFSGVSGDIPAVHLASPKIDVGDERSASGFLLQHALQGWCPPVPLLRQLGFRTSYEIEEER
jgi:hypothetical protein